MKKGGTAVSKRKPPSGEAGRRKMVKRLLNMNMGPCAEIEICYSKGAMASLNIGSRRLMLNRYLVRSAR